MMKDHLCDNCGRLEYLHGPWSQRFRLTNGCKEFLNNYYPFHKYNYGFHAVTTDLDPIIEYENQM